MAALNPIFNYHLFGIYIIELGNFFKQKFSSFKLINSGPSLICQVFFGTPRAAFRYYFERYNGLVKLPMLNYFLAETERKVEFEPAYVEIVSKDSYDSGKLQASRNPAVFELNFSCVLFNNTDRERDYMMHAIFNAFPKGELHLIHFPDLVNYPDIFLQMPYKLELNTTDETEIEGLEQSETRDRIKTVFTLRCTKAFVPQEAYEVDAVNYVNFTQLVNQYIETGEPSTTFYSNILEANMPIDLGVTVNTVTTH